METSGIQGRINSEVQVHLHACGDIEPNQESPPAFPGSSPRVWRHLLGDFLDRVFNRFISTRVETSKCRILRAEMPQVHLHACGDIWNKVQCHSLVLGSSPRVWRHRRRIDLARDRARFISTRVETSRLRPSLRQKRAVHLHACGDIIFTNFRPALAAGSSPRVWRHLRR